MGNNFRTDIQSLRGIQFYCFTFSLFSRYFSKRLFGCDIFFVISGYLMSKIINEKLTKNLVFLNFI